MTDNPTPVTGLDLEGLENAARGELGAKSLGEKLHEACCLSVWSRLPDGTRTVYEQNALRFAASLTHDETANAVTLSLISALRASEAEVVALKNTAPCLYPSAPGETRSGFSSNGVHVEGSQASIKAVTSWNHIASQAPQWSRAIDEANTRATTAEALVDRLRQEAEIHAGEARAHKSSLHEAYQAVSGATGEPGNWNGAEPIRAYVAKAEALAKEQAETIGELASALRFVIANGFIEESENIATAALSRTRPSGGDADGEQSQ